MELFMIIFNSFQLLIIITKRSILDVCSSPKLASELKINFPLNSMLPGIQEKKWPEMSYY